MLKSFSDCITDLTTKKDSKHVLSGKMKNNPIELQFGANHYLAGNHLALDIFSFARNSRTLLLLLVSELCQNKDNSCNKSARKYFFENAQLMITNLEKIKQEY